MIAWTNYHSHTDFCDGVAEPEAYVKAAIEKGMAVYGFSSHAPVPFFTCPWPMKLDRLDEYVDEVLRLRRKYEEKIEVLLSLEIDYIPDRMGPSAEFLRSAGLDYTVGSVHFVDSFPGGKGWEIDGPVNIFKKGLHEIFEGDIEAAVRRYFELTREMVDEDCPDILGHMDKIKMQNSREYFFSEDAPWYKDEVTQTLDAISKADTVLEVNTRGLYKKRAKETYPSKWVLKEALELDIPVHLSSDGHTPDEITANFDDAAKTLLDVGYDSCLIMIDGGWEEVELTPNGYSI